MLKNIKKYMKNNFMMMGYVFKFIPSYFVIHILNAIFLGVLGPLIQINFTRSLFDTVEQLATVQNPDFIPVVILFLVVVAYDLLRDAINIGMQYYYNVYLSNRLEEKMQAMIYQKAQSLDLECYDDPAFYDDFCWSMQNGSSRTTGSVDILIDFFGHLISLLTIVTIIATLDWVAIIVVIIYVAIDYIVKWKEAKINFDKAVDLNPVERKINYINRLFYFVEFAKELRLSKVAGLLLKKYDKAVDQQKELTIENIKKTFKLNLANDVSISILWDILFTIILVYRVVVSGTLTIGGMLAAQQAANDMRWRFSKWLYTIRCFKENSMYIDKFRNFMEKESSIKVDPDATEFEEPFNVLELKNVSFTYASKTEPAIKNINMTIHKNEKIALVGYNGAGKSTLIKTIMRLYAPQEGEMFVNNHNVSHYSVGSYQKIFGTVFQDFKLFSLSLAENVLMDEYDPSKEGTVRDALDKANFTNKLKQMPKGVQTSITKEFDEEGAILSGGEMQKVAIARTFAKDYDFIIMDEPSSALDPDSEYELNKLMMNSAYNKTVIFISHRLSTTRMADKIYMMENGQIIEEGSHEQLMKLNGKYAEMFNLQAEKYLQA